MQEKMTVTEGLAEIKLIEKKIEKKRAYVLSNLTRAEHVKDPLGDSRQVLTSEIQSITDLLSRHLKIRDAIAHANIKHKATVEGVEKSIYEWLVWKREIYANQFGFINSIHRNISNALGLCSQKPQVYQDENGKTQLMKVLAHVDMGEYVKIAESYETMHSKLDGILSLKNATIVIEF